VNCNEGLSQDFCNSLQLEGDIPLRKSRKLSPGQKVVVASSVENVLYCCKQLQNASAALSEIIPALDSRRRKTEFRMKGALLLLMHIISLLKQTDFY